MRWSDVRRAFPKQWLIIEALEAHTEGEQRHLDRIGIIELCDDATTVMPTYGRLHKEFPQRELYFVHTDREQLDIRVRWWFGIRGNHAANT